MSHVQLLVHPIAGLSLAAGLLAGIVTAQATADPISGGAGWVGAGLLGCVLAWLFFKHLPSKDKQISDLVQSRDVLVRELTADHRANIVDLAARAAEQDRERRKDYRESLATVVGHCEKETSANSAAIQRAVGELAPLIAELRPLIDEYRADKRRERGGHT